MKTDFALSTWRYSPNIIVKTDIFRKVFRGVWKTMAFKWQKFAKKMWLQVCPTSLFIKIIIMLSVFTPQLVQAAQVAQDVFDEIKIAGQAQTMIALHHPISSEALTRLQAIGIALVQDYVLQDLPANSFALIRRYQYVPALALSITQAALAVLMDHPQVRSIVLDEKDQLALTDSITIIKAEDVHALTPISFTGEGVVVAVLDTGIDTDHPYLVDDIVAQKCFTHGGCDLPNGGRGNESEDAEDDHGHGTHVAGIVTSSGTNAPGVAPDAKIVAIRICSPECYASDAIAALDWIRASLETYPVRVVNLSLGGGDKPPTETGKYQEVCDNTPSHDATDPPVINQLYNIAIKNLVDQNVVVFAASGNVGYSDRIYRPACLSSAIAVGATTKLDAVFYNYNRSKLIGVMAPGVSITSSWLNGTTGSQSGTSMATPMVSGAAALLLEANPGLTPDEILTIFQETGVSVYDSVSQLTFKRINLLDATTRILPSTLQFSPLVTGHFTEDSGTIPISVTRTEGNYGQVSVKYTLVDNTATYAEDYTALATDLLIWEDGDTATKIFYIDIIDDTHYEGEEEDFTIVLSEVAGWAHLGEHNIATITIIDNDVANKGALQFSAENYITDEDSSQLAVAVSRVSGSQEAVSVDYQVINGSATQGSDYQLDKGTLDWSNGDETDKIITVEIMDDDLIETEETFKIALSPPTNGAVLGAPFFTTVTIRDDDALPPEPPPIIEPPLPIYFPPPDYDISVKLAGSGTGKVSSKPMGIQCSNRAPSTCVHHRSDFLFHCLPPDTPEPCQASFEAGPDQVVTLIPEPAQDAVFIGWGGAEACNRNMLTMMLEEPTCYACYANRAAMVGYAACQKCYESKLVMTSEKQCVAYFSQLQPLTVIPNRLGRVVSYDYDYEINQIDCGQENKQCTGQFEQDKEVILGVIPATGARFIGWGGDCQRFLHNNPIAFPITEDKTCWARFKN
jgi:subtilisin family serine protease